MKVKFENVVDGINRYIDKRNIQKSSMGHKSFCKSCCRQNDQQFGIYQKFAYDQRLCQDSLPDRQRRNGGSGHDPVRYSQRN